MIIRGIAKSVIFRDDRDRDSFLDRLGGILLESSTPCYAWSLMSNHAHFLFRTGDISIARLMRRLLTSYAVTFNRQYRRNGHLFQNRYKSILCEEDAYLQELVNGVDMEDLKSGSKVPSIAKARAVLCYVGVRALGLTSASIAKELGISPSAVSKAIIRVPQFLEHEELEALMPASQ